MFSSGICVEYLTSPAVSICWAVTASEVIATSTVS